MMSFLVYGIISVIEYRCLVAIFEPITKGKTETLWTPARAFLNFGFYLSFVLINQFMAGTP